MKKYWLLVLLLAGCVSPQDSPETLDKLPVLIDLNGTEFFVPELTPQQKVKLDSNVLVAKENLDINPSEENYIWYGRRLAYRYHINKAIEVFTEGISKYPESPRLYRHRGHRYISIRQFDKAIEDLTKAAELMAGMPIDIEPDGQPNKLDIALSSTQFNVWYHLALAHYLKGDFEKAKQAYFSCLSVSSNPDLLVATIDWLYMTYQREGKKQAADSLLLLIDENIEVIENDSYLNRLKMYGGKLTPEEVLNPDPASEDYNLALATQGYGVANWYLYHQDTLKAKEILNRIVKTKSYTSFGFIAAESELVWLNGCNPSSKSAQFCAEKISKMKELLSSVPQE